MPDHDSQRHPGDHLPWMAADPARDFNSPGGTPGSANGSGGAARGGAHAAELRRPGAGALRVPALSERTDRRSFIKQGLVAGGLLAGAGYAISQLGSANGGTILPSASPTALPTRGVQPTSTTPQPPSTPSQPVARNVPGAAKSYRKPNILVILVDQLRTPVWFPASSQLARMLPNLTQLQRGGVLFDNHFTASNDCTPARSTLLTGLYTHQTGCMITGGSTLDPGFPTWGTMLRDQAYNTYYYGKWHLTHGDGRWRPKPGLRSLERYGFSGGTFPSPDGGPGQGWREDPRIAKQFEEWYGSEAGQEPWCTTVSFVNPHDIAWWYVWSDRVPAESSAPPVFNALPPNFETPEQLAERNKPTLQLSLQTTAAQSFGHMPFTGPDLAAAWTPFLDLYLKLQRNVDYHIGRVMKALWSKPDVAENTIVVLTSDHGEYGASHGLRGKGAGAYDEAIRVPLLVKDLRKQKVTGYMGQPRSQLSSSVDVAAMLLTLATGSNQWRLDGHYSHIASRLDLTRILSDKNAPGRPYILHATDEVVTEFAAEPYAANAPLHVIALRTPQAKYATYSYWQSGGMSIQTNGEQSELYDYSNQQGQMEVANVAGSSSIEEPLRNMLNNAIAQELREPLPGQLGVASARGLRNFEYASARAASTAALRRIRRAATAISI